MKMTTLFAVLLFLVGCGSAPTDVAITQTGNPSIVTLGVSLGEAPAKSAAVTSRGDDAVDNGSDDSGDDDTPYEEPEITSLTITSAELMVDAVVLTGPAASVEFRKIPPYLINVAFDSSRVVLDSLAIPTGTVFDSMTLVITPDLNSNLLEDKSIKITGYTNNNSEDSFIFTSQLSIEKRVALTSPLIVSETLPNRITVKLDVNSWFLDSDTNYIDPNDDEFAEDIEETILESIYGEEDHDDEDEEEEEEKNGEKYPGKN